MAMLLSKKALTVAALLAAAIAGLFEIVVPIYQRGAAAGAVERIGGRVGWTLAGPDWMRRAVGDRWMRLLRDEATSIHLQRTAADDRTAAQIAALDGVELIDLRHTDVTDSGLKRLSRLRKLKHLNVFNTRVTPAGIAAIERALPNLIVCNEPSARFY